MNVHDHLKDLPVSRIQDYCRSNAIDASVVMINFGGDFNLSTVIRNANFFGFKEVAYVNSSKKWDKRGSVGTYHYTPLKYFSNEKDMLEYFKDNTIVAVENNIPKYDYKTTMLNEYRFAFKNPVFVFGEEQSGLSDFILNEADCVLTIPAHGSVRSLNVGTTSGIIMNHHRTLVEWQKSQVLTTTSR